MRQEKKQRSALVLLAVAFGVLGGLVPARSECLSPSVEAGATTTTVYRCQEVDASAGQQPVIVDPGKTTTVERGSADVPWFEPKPTQTADPIQVPQSAPAKAEPDKKEEVVKIEPLPVEAAKTVEPKTVEPQAAEPEAAETQSADTETPAAEPKAGKTKKTKAKVAKAKRGKVKLAKAKRSKAKLAQKRTKAKPVTAEATPPEEIKTEPAKTDPPKTDSKIIVMTRKNMPLGSRIKNWFGF